MSSTIVLKFGGSFLRGQADLVRAVHAIYAHVRRGRRVLAVTSAFFGRTDELERALLGLELDADAPSGRRIRAALLGTGELETAALLTAALERSGVPARLADVKRTGPFVAPGTSDPVRLDHAQVESLFQGGSVAVLPGFVAVEEGDDPAPALLGRGGSDLTAVFVAAELGARCILVKDVDGLYTSDPAGRDDEVERPRRFARVSFGDAAGLGQDILQPRALAHAARRRLAFEVVGPRAVAGVRGTHVGELKTVRRAVRPPAAPLRVGLLGLGTVGARVFAELQARPDLFEVTGIMVRDLARKERPVAAVDLLTDDLEVLLAGAPDLVVEATGGVEPAGTQLRALLDAGVHVVTANKAALARSVPRLEDSARRAGSRLFGSASVGGALPALETIRRLAREGSGKDAVVGFEGVLNGTTNAVLSSLARGLAFGDAVAEAQAAGLAEADPQADLDGTDIAHKLELLAEAAGWCDGDRPLRWLHREGLDACVQAPTGSDERLALVGSVHRSEIGPVASITLRTVRPGDPFHRLEGPENALVLDHVSGARTVVRGRGAGAWPTATAVMGDVFALARRLALTGRAPGAWAEARAGYRAGSRAETQPGPAAGTSKPKDAGEAPR